MFMNLCLFSFFLIIVRLIPKPSDNLFSEAALMAIWHQLADGGYELCAITPPAAVPRILGGKYDGSNF
jgi:hypothetical protein